MALLGRLAGMFGSEVRARGRDYQRGGAVKITRHTDDSLRAAVQGTRSYRVDVDWARGDFDYRCNCPYGQEFGEPCKHIWATLLEADERGLLPASAGANGDARHVVNDEDEDEVAEESGNGSAERRNVPSDQTAADEEVEDND